MGETVGARMSSAVYSPGACTGKAASSSFSQPEVRTRLITRRKPNLHIVTTAKPDRQTAGSPTIPMNRQENTKEGLRKIAVLLLLSRDLQ